MPIFYNSVFGAHLSPFPSSNKLKQNKPLRNVFKMPIKLNSIKKTADTHKISRLNLLRNQYDVLQQTLTKNTQIRNFDWKH